MQIEKQSQSSVRFSLQHVIKLHNLLWEVKNYNLVESVDLDKAAVRPKTSLITNLKRTLNFEKNKIILQDILEKFWNYIHDRHWFEGLNKTSLCQIYFKSVWFD